MSNPVKLSVEFPSVAYREGPAKVIEMGQAIEGLGYDEIAIFDHVVMGYSVPTRPDSMYPAQMPILEALTLMSYLAAATTTVGLSTEVLVLPQRQPALVAKQVSTIDTLSGGRVRLGIGVGWQQSEYDALHENFADRGKRMDEAIELLRRYWGDDRIDFDSDFYPTEAMALEPKP
ncbi:MAG: TIGR03619 family F420-dependent LLM class oxidoreductase, partial [Actinomycetota bacterium]|nr:TIGR03619 family F420-dependent LLM class oxidoreductase [Actinomycetota bacterium]